MTTRRTLTITMSPDWRAALRQAGNAAQADSDQGKDGIRACTTKSVTNPFSGKARSAGTILALYLFQG